MNTAKTIKFVNCKILRNSQIIVEDLWVRNGKIINPEVVFFDEKIEADRTIDCKHSTIVPGFIELQINGGFGYDFSHNVSDVEKGVDYVAKQLLSHGVTAFCPTVVTSPGDTYKHVLPRIKKKAGGTHGATILGVHAEGPFINVGKKGAHQPDFIKNFEKGFDSVLDIYGNLDNIIIITLAPELDRANEIIKRLSDMNIVVSVGHSMADLSNGEDAVRNGATLVTHLFNAMLPFHHRDPGLVGLLASNKIPKNKTVYFGIISDGIHTHPAALRIAHRVHPDGLILVTDAISALGLEEGKHNIGQFAIEIRNKKAYIAGTDTLCGSIASMIQCVQLFHKETGCSMEYALEAASLHPAKALGIEGKKGTLNFGSDADFVILDDNLNLKSTWIAGECLNIEVVKQFVKVTGSSKDNPLLFILDNHDSHLAPEALNIAKDGVTLLTIPPHSSHKLQLLDVSVFGPLHTYYNAAVDSWLLRHPGTLLTILQNYWGQAFEKAMKIY